MWNIVVLTMLLGYCVKCSLFTDAELGLTGYVMFTRDRIGRRGGELFYM